MKWRSILFAGLAAIASACAPAKLFATCPCQSEPAAPLSKDAEEAPEAEASHFDSSQYATDNWFGLRKTLYDYGIDLSASYVTEPAGNPSGGLKQSLTYLHNLGFGIQLDLDKIACIPGATFLVSVSQRSGSGLTQEAIGNAISVQEIFGGGQTTRLVQMRWDQKLFDDRLEFSLGRLTTTSDFLSSPFYCDFVTNGICGQPPAPFFNIVNGLTAYPAAYWGGLILVRPIPDTYAKVGIYDGDPTHGDDRHGLNFGFGDNGVLIMSEIGYKPKSGIMGLPCRYSLGGYYHTGDFHDVAQDSAADNIFITGHPGRIHAGHEGFYLLFEQMLLPNAVRPGAGLSAFFTFVLSPDEDKSTMPYFLNGGLVYDGLIPGRPNDKTDLGFYTAIFSDSLRGAQHGAHLPGQTSETDIELNHQFQITRYLYVRPNIQYVIKPNGLSTIENALVLGAEIGITF